MNIKETRKDVAIRKSREKIDEAKKIATQIGITGEKSGMTIDAILCATGKHSCDLGKLSGFYGQDKFIKELERVRKELKNRNIHIIE